MAAGREIRSKIGSVRSTQKITSAMEMVAASKMQRTQQKMHESRPYARKIREVIGHLAAATPEYRHKYMVETPTIKQIGYLVITTDKGLCGGLNINLLRMLLHDMRNWDGKGVAIDLGLIGRKARVFFNTYGGNVVCALDYPGRTPTPMDLVGSVKIMLDAYAQGKLDRLFLVSNEFINTMTQTPRIEQLLPLSVEPVGKGYHYHWDYIYEPDARELLGGLITRYIEAQVYQAVVENIACEQAAKMIAMKNATENAGELIDELRLLYNNVRQAAITREIAEIIGGAAAV